METIDYNSIAENIYAKIIDDKKKTKHVLYIIDTEILIYDPVVLPSQNLHSFSVNDGEEDSIIITICDKD